jgi:hypothetical protein
MLSTPSAPCVKLFNSSKCPCTILGGRASVTRHEVWREIRTRSLARLTHLVYSRQVDFLTDSGVDFNATRYRTVTSVGPRSHGGGGGSGVGHRPASGLALKHGPALEESLPAGGPRSKPCRTAAPLSRLWTTLSCFSAIVGVRSRIAPSASSLGSRAHPRRTEANRSRQRASLGADNPALAAQARSGPGPSRSTSDHMLEAGGASA